MMEPLAKNPKPPKTHCTEPLPSYPKMDKSLLSYSCMILKAECTVERKTCKDNVTKYMANTKNDRVHRFSVSLGIEENYLRALMNMHNTKQRINEFGRFDKLMARVDHAKTSIFLKKATGKKHSVPMTKIRIAKMLRDFLIKEDLGFEIPE